jgi:N-acetylneuraminic acid mutarotase
MNFAGKTVAAILLMSVSAAFSESSPEFSQLPPLPDREGFAGAFAGVSDGCLLVAGGANFPDKRPWENGKKVWYDTVFVLDKPDGVWRIAGKLPMPLGYGVSVTTGDGVVCIGGSDAEKHHGEVFRLTLRGGAIHTESLPSLPVPLANGAGALLDGTVYVFGGSDQPGDKSAMNRLFALDLKSVSPHWKELEPFPGKGRILPVAAALDGGFYIAGGAALEQTNGKISRVYLRDAGCYRPGSGWSRVADLPRPVVAAPSPAPASDSKFYILGGDDGSLVGFSPPEKHPGFSKSMLIYDARGNVWSTAGGMPVSRAVLPTAYWEGRWVLPNGEARPGVRSPEVWAFTPAP